MHQIGMHQIRKGDAKLEAPMLPHIHFLATMWGRLLEPAGQQDSAGSSNCKGPRERKRRQNAGGCRQRKGAAGSGRTQSLTAKKSQIA